MRKINLKSEYGFLKFCYGMLYSTDIFHRCKHRKVAFQRQNKTRVNIGEYTGSDDDGSSTNADSSSGGGGGGGCFLTLIFG